jgi:hypothetical protein
MKTKVILAMSANGLEKKLNKAIVDIEQQGKEVVSVTPWSMNNRALILYQ